MDEHAELKVLPLYLLRFWFDLSEVLGVRRLQMQTEDERQGKKPSCWWLADHRNLYFILRLENFAC
jgi:hypothetical protein